MESIIALAPTDRGDIFRLKVSADLCVGPAGHVFLFGGAGLGGAIAAMEQCSGRKLICATAQYLSYARAGAFLDLGVSILAAGKQVTQAQVIARIGEDIIFAANGALGERDGWPMHQWRTAPDIPAPDQCIERQLWPLQSGGLLDRFEVRVESRAINDLNVDGIVSDSGRLAFWLRSRDATPIDAAFLALVADFVPAGVAAALGRLGGGNSLDNNMRMGTIVPTDWLLCDVAVDVAARGFAHGDIRIFAQDGTLMATGNQSLALRFVPV